MTDNGAGEKRAHGNGEENPRGPAPVPPIDAATSPGPGNGACASSSIIEKLAQVPAGVRDLKTGRMLPGHSLNPKGRPPGIPNKNAEYQRLLTTKELRECQEIAKAQARKGHCELLMFLLDRALIKLTPETAGIIVHSSPTINETNVTAHIVSDPAARELAAKLEERVATASILDAGGNGSRRQ